MIPSAFHFLRPYALLALLPLGVLLLLLPGRIRKGKNPWRAVCDPHLLPHLLGTAGSGRRRWPWVAMALGALLSVLALAGPTWQRRPQPAYLNQSGLVIVLDLSSSMNAADLTPSRVVRARYKIADLLRSRHEGQTGLVVYAGDAFTVTPLTDDTNTIYSQLSVLTPSLMPSQGDRADLAVAKAASLLRQAGLRRGNVLLVADGVDAARLRPAVKKLREEGYRLSILGVGTAQGAPVPRPGGGFQVDGRGAVALSRLQAPVLRRMARLGGGLYRRISPTDQDLHFLQAGFSRRLAPGATQKARVKVDTWREEGPWLLLPVLLLAALAFRRGVLAVLLLFLFCAPQPARAMSWRGLWLNRDQRGSRALAHGDPGQAAKLFTNPRWKAAAYYRSGDYARALKALQGCTGKNDWYNRGNALARLGRYREALRAYDEALKKDPGFKDARFNKRLVEKLLRKKKQQKKKKKGSKAGHSARGSKGGASHNRKGSAGKRRKQPEKQGKKAHGKGSSGANKAASGSRGRPAGKGRKSVPRSAKGTKGAKQGAAKSAAQRRERRQAAARQKSGAASSSGKKGRSVKGAAGKKGKAPRSTLAPKPISAATAAKRERQQADQQWLRQVPDDPGGLLRRKFYYEYRQRHPDAAQGEQPW